MNPKEDPGIDADPAGAMDKKPGAAGDSRAVEDAPDAGELAAQRPMSLGLGRFLVGCCVVGAVVDTGKFGEAFLLQWGAIIGLAAAASLSHASHEERNRFRYRLIPTVVGILVVQLTRAGFGSRAAWLSLTAFACALEWHDRRRWGAYTGALPADPGSDG